MTAVIDPGAATPVFVVGAGIMGAGIAQVAAQAGHPVALFDAREGAAADAHVRLRADLEALAARGKLAPDAVQAALARIRPAQRLQEAAEAALVVEAIVENADAKRALFRELEGIVGDGCVLASNTSSISVTALANGLRQPDRFVGMHFFNPVPLMKLVEVVSGLQTDPAVAAAVEQLAARWGKVPVHARSTPGFIVNRIARPFYAEALALLQERAAKPDVLDACLRGAGFRMGPCELMDLIGQDTNFAVTESVYAAYFGDKRFVPSPVQRELVDGGLLGRKSGRGFYVYGGAATPKQEERPTGSAVEPAVVAQGRCVLHGQGAAVERWATILAQAGRAFDRRADSTWRGLETTHGAGHGQLRETDGRPAARIAAELGLKNVAVYDFAAGPAGGAPGAALAWSVAGNAAPSWQDEAAQWLCVAGWIPQRIADAAGLIAARTIAMLVNEAADAVHQGVCTAEGADLAMKLGVNYPAGPFEWLARWDARRVVELLDHLDCHYRGERYRVSPELRQRAWTQESASP
jgi:3-hydroxybutyryl-CoA dehydrogenase